MPSRPRWSPIGGPGRSRCRTGSSWFRGDESAVRIPRNRRVDGGHAMTRRDRRFSDGHFCCWPSPAGSRPLEGQPAASFKAGFAERDITPDDRHGGARRLRQGVPSVDPRPVQGPRGRLRRRPIAGRARRHRRPGHPSGHGPEGPPGGPGEDRDPGRVDPDRRLALAFVGPAGLDACAASTTMPRRWSSGWPTRSRRSPTRSTSPRSSRP